MDRWGVWTENDGGFITAPCYSQAEAEEIRQDYIDAARAQAAPGEAANEAADPAADLSVIRMCDDHDEQPHDGCQDCDTDDTEED